MRRGTRRKAGREPNLFPARLTKPCHLLAPTFPITVSASCSPWHSRAGLQHLPSIAPLLPPHRRGQISPSPSLDGFMQPGFTAAELEQKQQPSLSRSRLASILPSYTGFRNTLPRAQALVFLLCSTSSWPFRAILLIFAFK